LPPFRARASLKLPRQSRPEIEYVDFPNVDKMIGLVIAHRQATLHELKTVYTLEDLYDLFEVIAVTSHNEFLTMDRGSK